MHDTSTLPSPEELKNFKDAYPGAIKIDCSGAYIANDHLLRDSNQSSNSGSASTSATGTPSPEISSESDEDEDSVRLADTSRSDHEVDADDEDFDFTKNITLPQHNSEIIHISVDIGGTLTKLVYFTKSKKSQSGGKLHFRDFQTENLASETLHFMIKLIQKSITKSSDPPITYIMATGGGASKFYQLMNKSFRKRKLPMKIIAKDEMECLIKGLDWLITKIPNEIFTYDLETDHTISSHSLQHPDQIYPYLLVNIGSGVSMIKVTGPGPDGFERIGGSSLGGGTLWGLLSLLTDAKDYNEMLEMALRGNNENIDLLVGDIYGSNYNKIGLKSSHIASSFAKVFKKLRFNSKPMTPAEKLAHFRPEDISRSLLYLVSNNIGQIAYLQAVRFNLKRIYFGGSYISGHMQTIHTLSYAVNFWSKGDMKSYFLRHEGYLGSVGAFVMGPQFGAGQHSPK
ncbi:fumble-domain-containing protein [Suhomyces tanzawaensis NRRL Y-17324]|uniref:Fumble-domain-containing protein n=1 Tax=Suhomyces tanzawaensis NRRL Y-17324 TaxID=984487 RepID=A0A1E4SCW3_9ASCO|nr:fumble-domain-containing protein [Suhomyces tanzawaensis NRRL Y-17324]ODV77306.1 fumble-domain-containing protein [Suhomyces tanzawaensis NRRL Y-17324]